MIPHTHIPTNIQRDIKDQYGVDLNYIKAWRGKERHDLNIVRTTI